MKAIVTGISGQDGYFMARQLLNLGYRVLGLTSDLERARAQLAELEDSGITLLQFNYMQPIEFREILDAFVPDVVFNFAAIATGRGMFDAPAEISRLNADFVVMLLDTIRSSSRRGDIVFCQASSSEMFGDAQESPQTEQTPFKPKSPYGAAKLYAHNLVNIYRASYGVRCGAAILYNHESTRRTAKFVTKKIAISAVAIKRGRARVLELGSLESSRDWGYAPEYVDAIYRMSLAEGNEDYIVASGRLTTVRQLCEYAFECVGLDYREYVVSDASEIRSVESKNLVGDASKIARDLNWCAGKSVRDIMIEMVEYEMDRQ